MRMRLRKVNLRDAWVYICAVPCLFMMLVTSRGFREIKIVLLFLTTLFCFFDSIIGRKRMMGKYALFVGIFVFYYMGSLIRGVRNGYEWSFDMGASLLEVYCFTPIVILIISTFLIQNKYYLPELIRLIRRITVFIVIMNVWKLVASRSSLPDIDFLDLFYVSSSNAAQSLSLRISNEHNLIFLLPFFTVMLFMENSKRHRIIDLLILSVGALYCILSGRKMLEITVIGTLVIMIFYMAVKKKKLKPLFIILALCVGLVFAAGQISSVLGVENVLKLARDTIVSGFSMQHRGMTVRILSMKSLIKLWSLSPMMGNGLNSYGDYLASSTTKWNYEIYYVALLAQTGVIGIGILFVGIWHILKNLRYKYKTENNPVYIAAFAGMLCFVISGASNPMLYIPWPWILSLVLSCCSLKTAKAEQGDICDVDCIKSVS